MSVFGNRSRKSSKNNSSPKNVFGGRLMMKAGPKRPLPKQEAGCTVHDEFNKDRHVYTMYGKPYECCIKCGMENRMVTEWRQNVAINGESLGHPYVVSGIWSLNEYKNAMKRGGIMR